MFYDNILSNKNVGTLKQIFKGAGNNGTLFSLYVGQN